MKVLIDTTVLLDVFLERKPFFEASAQTVGLAEKAEIEGWICGTTVPTISPLRRHPRGGVCRQDRLPRPLAGEEYA